MSIRLDPRRVNALKHLAGEAGVRPGDLVRQWVEERIDGQRGIEPGPGAAETPSVMGLLEALSARVAALESGERPATGDAPVSAAPEEAASGEADSDADAETAPAARTPRKRVTAGPSAERVALHDEMIAVLSAHGPMTAAELAGAIAERGRYAPPRSGKPLDAAMVSQRVSNPTYRSRFVRNEGRIGLAE